MPGARILGSPSVAFAYALMIAAVNLLNPLLPVLQDESGLATAELAGVYSIYLFVLVGVLAVLAKARPPVSPRMQVIGALLCTILADLMHTLGSVWAIGIGRALLSVSIGVATGAVAEYMVASIGERGRTTTATANIGGAFLGTGGAGVVVLLSSDPMRHTFFIHVALLLAVTLLVTLFATPGGMAHTASDTKRNSPNHRPARSLLVSGFLMGSLAWISAASVIVLAPAAYKSHGGNPDAWVTVLVLSLFGAAFASQHAVGRSLRRFREAAVVLVLGMILLAVAAAQVRPGLLLTGGALVGVGYGAVFRMGMLMVSRGLDQRNQARQASRYAGIAYLASSLSLVGGGVLVDELGGATALSLLALAVAGGLLLCQGLGHRLPPVAGPATA